MVNSKEHIYGHALWDLTWVKNGKRKKFSSAYYSVWHRVGDLKIYVDNWKNPLSVCKRREEAASDERVLFL